MKEKYYFETHCDWERCLGPVQNKTKYIIY